MSEKKDVKLNKTVKQEGNKKALKGLKDMEKGKAYQLSNFKVDSLVGIIRPHDRANLFEFAENFNAVLKTAKFNPNQQSFQTLINNVLNSYLLFDANVKEDVVIKEEGKNV